MLSTLRKTTSVRLHQLWDVVARGKPNQTMDFEYISSQLNSIHGMPPEYVKQELRKAIGDGLIVAEVAGDAECYHLPDVTNFEKGSHDWFCFGCHGGSKKGVKCDHCFRVYHLDCLSEDRKLEKDTGFVCPSCHLIATKPSTDSLQMEQVALNELLHQLCGRLNKWQAEILETANGVLWAETGNRTAADAWRFNLLIHTPMDLQTMRAKAKDVQYTCLEEFQVDCQSLVHALGIYFGLDMLQSGQLGHRFSNAALQAIVEVQRSHQVQRE